MIKVFILVLWATGAGAETGPEPYSTLADCMSQGESMATKTNGYEDFGCTELEITQPE